MKKTLAIGALLLAGAFATMPAAQAENWAKYKIMIDPGHGGTDPGASGPTAPHEATLALRCAKTLTTKFTTLGAPYKLTRSTDTYISLSARKSASVSYDPYIFCSIHLNAFNGTANGTETWYYWTTGNSLLLANCVHGSLIAEMKRANRGVKRNGWTVITGSSNVPAILTEGLFVDNKTEHDLIKTEGSTGYNNWVNGHLYGFYDRLKLLSGTITNPRSTTTPTTPDPVIKVNNTDWRFDCDKGSSASANFSVTGSNLTSDIAVSSNNSLFTVTKASGFNARTGGTITIKYSPTEAGTHSGTVTIKAGTVSTKITCTGIATAPALTFTEKWNFSDKNGTATYKGWDATAVRNMTFMNGKLYLVYNQSDIKVVKSGTLAADDTGVLGNLNKGNIVAGGTLTLCDVKACDGKIVACNLSGTATTPLRVYVWDNDKAMARLAMETTDKGGATRLGDCIGWRGTWTSGELVFCNDDGGTTRIVTYPVTNGTISATPTVKTVTTDGSTQLKTAASTRVYPQTTGKYWVDGKDNNTALVDANGKREIYMDQDESWGNALATFTWENTSYALATTFNPREGESFSTQTEEQKAKNYTGGCFHLLRCDEGYAKPQFIARYPTNGLSDTRQNSNCTQNVIINQTGTTIEAWVLSANQGIAYYISKGGTAPTYTYENIPVINTDPTMTANVSKINLTAAEGESISKTVKVTAANLTGNVTMGLTGDAAFTLNKTSLTPTNGALDAASFKVTFNPTSVGNYSATLKISAAGVSTITIPVTGTATEKTVMKDEIDKLDETWNYSVNRGNIAQAAWFNPGGMVTRDMCVVGDNMYVLSVNGVAPNAVHIVNARTGADTGKTLNLTGVSGGTIPLSGIKALGSAVIGANYAGATGALKVYKWDSATAAPVEILNTTDHGGLGMGRSLSTYGDMTNGKIAFAGHDGSAVQKVVYYTVTNGTVNPTPNVITLDKYTGGNESNQSVAFLPDGSFILNHKDSHPVHYSATGQTLGTFTADHMAGKQYGAAASVLTYNNRQYAAMTTTLGSATSAAWGNGAFSLVDVTGGVANAKPVGTTTYPAAGLGPDTWGGVGVNSVAHQVDDNGDTRVWVMVPHQGAAMYSFAAQTPSGIEEISAAQAAGENDAAWYTLQGVRVDGSNLAPGIYVRRTAAKATKVLVK